MTETLADTNKAYFDNFASQYGEKRWLKDLADQITRDLRNNLDFIGVNWATGKDDRSVRLLDYAAGTGVITRALGPYVTQTRGIDVSSGMADKYNNLTRASGISSDTAFAQAGNLVVEHPDASLDVPELHNFDIAAIGLGFHHFDNHALAIRRLAERLKPDGVLLIIDLVEDGGRYEHEANKTTSGHGFSEAEMKDMYIAEGLVDVGFKILEQPVRMDMTGGTVHRKVFLARASKPAS